MEQKIRIFDLPHGEIYEFTPLAGLAPPKGIGKGQIIRVGSGQFEDKVYIYEWDGFHDGGEWEVYNKKTGVHVGVLDPITQTWHSKKKAKPGRRISLFFPTLIRSSGAIFFGPIAIDFELGEIPASGIKLLDKERSAQAIEMLEQDGIKFPHSLYWNFYVGENVSLNELQNALIETTSESKSFWRRHLPT